MAEDNKPEEKKSEEDNLEYDRKLVNVLSEMTSPKNLDLYFTAMLGAAYQSVEGIRTPVACVTKVAAEARTLFVLPPETPKDLSAQAKAFQENAFEKVMTWMMAWSEVGKKFTGEAQ
jgi:hypothetical protein